MSHARDEQNRVRFSIHAVGALIYRAVLVVVFASVGAARGQVPAPAYVDDSPLAAETLAQIDGLINAGSRAEAARALQRLLDGQGDRLIETGDDLFNPVRAAVMRSLLDRPGLLRAYVEQQNPEAERLLAAGRHREVERARLLTDAGFEATLRVAQEQLESGRFDSAWRTLRQLDRHPLMQHAVRAREAAALASTIAGYLDRDDAGALVARWSRLAGGPAASIRRVEPPPGLDNGERAALAPFGAATLSGLVPTPLQSVLLPSASEWTGETERGRVRSYWVIPSIVEGTVLINDGAAVVALDRFTLRRLWRTPPAPENDAQFRNVQSRRHRTRMIEDPSTVTSHDRVVLAPLGHVISGRREGDDRLLCLDRATGETLWAVEPGELTPETAGASIRGPVAVDGGTVVVALRKNERARRIISIYLAGLDLADGSVRWTRLVGSVGALPYQQQTRAAQAVTVWRGAAYLVDEIGLTIAVETDTGRTLWLRRSSGLTDQGLKPSAWTVHAPIPDGGAVIAVSPDRLSVRRFDAETGRMQASVSARRIGSAVYLLDLPGGIVGAAGESRVVYLDRETLADLGLPPLDVASSHEGFTGRVSVSGDRLVAPVKEGVLVCTPGEKPELIPLDSTGNAAVAPGQVLVADDTRLRSYLVWDVAASMLKERIEANPADPTPAVTYAELADRAGRRDEIIPAIDMALSALDRSPPGEAARAASSRLFDVVLEMIGQTHAGWFDADTPRGRTSADGTMTSALIDRLGRIADTPAQRVAYALALGRQQEASGRAAQAAATYQRLLSDSLLAGTSWRGPRASIRAELEAERRLHALVRREGADLYAPFDAEARGALATVDRGDAGALERLARRYPLSTAAAEARLLEAEALEAGGDPRRALRAGGGAVETLRRLVRDGMKVDPDLLGRAYGSQIVALTRANRLEEAGALAAEADRDHPGLVLLDGQTPIGMDEVMRDLAARLAARRTKPRIGRVLVAEEEPQLIRGYTLHPLARAEPGGASRSRFDGVLVVSQDDGTLSWYAPESDDGPLRAVWTRHIEDRPDPLLLRIDEVSAWMFWPTAQGGWLERMSLDDGTSMWVGPEWETLVQGIPLHAQDEQQARSRFIDPIEGRVRPEELLLTMDSRTIILAERGGRGVAFDAGSGEVLWSRTLPLLRLHDVDTAGSVFAMGGVGVDRRGEPGPMLATLDARTGEPIHVDDKVAGEVRWVRVTASGDLIAGLNDRVISSSPTDGRLNFELVNPEMAESDEAWLLGDRLLVRAPDDRVWMVDARSGLVGPEPLDTRGRLNMADRVVVEPLGGGGFLMASTDGVCVFGPSGDLAGVDAFVQPARVLPAAVAEGLAAVLKIERGRFGLGGTRFILHLLETSSGRTIGSNTVRLFGEPLSVDAIDGRVLIDTGDVTVVLRAPAGR